MSCSVGQTHGLDLALLWLWCKLAATALIRPLAWEPPYAMGVALKSKKKRKKKKENRVPLTHPMNQILEKKKHEGEIRLLGLRASGI